MKNTRLDDDWPVWGCVLIGGRSRRMGRPKHLIEAGGCSWLERTVLLLGQCVGRVVIVGPGEVPSALAATERLADAEGAAGPLAGILAAFRAHPGISWLVAACDLPDMEIGALHWLLACRAPGVVAVLPDLAGDGRIEPLLAYYDHGCAHLLEAMAAAGQRRMNRLREAPGVITPQPPAHLRGSWRNVNTPEELGAGPVTR